MNEQTLVIIKPDGVARRLTGRIIQRLEDKGLTITDIKMTTMTAELAKEHYQHLQGRPFFDELIAFMTSGPVVYLIIEGPQAVAVVRRMIGATNSLEAEPGTIRGDFGLSGTQNIIHASDTPENARLELLRFFTQSD
ncbi:nucleoside-diphosphate kinase [Vagococcus acidifermentans]|uniref:Nucleoside diphosphate kinase n=1 Tax=Vagococcus acidifermentans TaxID=564710 RepID=A0A430ASV7_9ENTE|nr:nucleoside-diphosphate kinase [Vagococcus acidifermentans]RSU11142.1 nucleoside-diphosphate kinase [Vagococcus acidifermentans]